MAAVRERRQSVACAAGSAGRGHGEGAACWRSLRAELRGVALRGCAAIGLTTGLVWGLKHPVHPRCSTVGRVAALNRCTSHSISVIATHWALALGGGFVAGGLVGVLVALAIGIEKT